MKSIKQLLRQPLKSLCGIALVAAAVCILCLTWGQYSSSREALKKLDDQYNTVALLTDESNYSSNKTAEGFAIQLSSGLPDEVLEWIETTVNEHPELVKLDSRPGLASAYIPELNPDLYVEHDYRHISTVGNYEAGSWIPDPEGAPYTCAMLEVTVERIDVHYYYVVFPWGKEPSTTPGGSEIICRIDGVHTLPDGYHDPTGYYARLIIRDVPPEELTDQYPIGSRWLVYGNDYYDWDWQVRETLRYQYETVHNSEVIIDTFDPEKLTYYTEAQIEASGSRYYGEYKHGYKNIRLDKYDVRNIRSIEMTEPEMVRLDGTAEEFFASDAGSQWAKYLEYAAVNGHAFPIIGVDKLGYIGNFAQGSARIVEGRDFTQEELESGAKVCIMAQSLASANGLAVGDTICPQYYKFDSEMKAGYRISSGVGTTEPTAYFFGENTPFEGEAEAYTIVGLYRGSEWQNPQDNLYGFTPNTIFTPKKAVTGTMDYADNAFFRTLVLENGKMNDLMDLASASGYDDMFECYDQGYSDVAPAFESYADSAGRAAVLGGGAYLLLMTLYLLLFPGSQGKVLITMDSLGAAKLQKVRHITLSVFGILLPGTVLGTFLGTVLWDRVSEALRASVNVALQMDMDLNSMVGLSLVQAICILLLSALLALYMTGKHRAMKRK